MTAKQIMDFIEQYAYEEDMFGELKQELDFTKDELVVKMEHDPDNKDLKREYRDIFEKLRMISIARTQRLELFRQAKIREVQS